MAAHNENLRFDRRLTHRRGWISEKDLARHLRTLPDVEDRGEWVDPVGDSEAAAESGPGESAPGAEEAAAPAAQAIGDAPQAMAPPPQPFGE